jgi:serine/threonine protein kinase
VLSDFGISKVRDEKLRTDVDVSQTFAAGANATGKIVMGTEGYMAPETLRGEEATPAADVYSLGVVFFKLLTGVWYDPDMAKGNKTAIRLLDHFEQPWAKILPQMLDEDPAKRITDLDALAAMVGPAHQAPASRKNPGKWLWWTLGGGLAAAAAGILLSFAAETQPVTISDEDLSNAFRVPESLK